MKYILDLEESRHMTIKIEAENKEEAWEKVLEMWEYNALDFSNSVENFKVADFKELSKWKERNKHGLHTLHEKTCTRQKSCWNYQKIVELGGVEICGGLGTGKPVITENEIVLNGSERLNQDYETFALTNPPEDFNFTKTEYRPYDKVVVAILCSALYLKCRGSKNISSDGNYGDWDSSGGIDLFKRHMKKYFIKSGRWKVYIYAETQNWGIGENKNDWNGSLPFNG